MTKAEQLAREIMRTRKQLGLNGEAQQELLKDIRAAFDLTNDELASALNVPLVTLLAYLAPESAKKHRKMAAADLLVLSRILQERKRNQRG